MKKTNVLVLCFCLIVLSTSLLAEEDHCRDILNNGIFNESSSSSTTAFKQSFIQLCYSAEFQTHQEARDAGIGLGVKVYGVPLSFNGTFSDSQVTQWKKENQKYVNTSMNYATAHDNYLRAADQGIVNAWLQCMQSEFGQGNFDLSISPVGKNYVYVWTRFRSPTTGETVKIKSLQIPGLEELKGNALCKNAIIPSEHYGVGGLFKIIDPNNISITINAKSSTTGATYSQSKEYKPIQNRFDDIYSALPESGFVVGEIRIFAVCNDEFIANLEKKGWLVCDGDDYNKYNYPELYRVLQADNLPWGAASPGNTFTVPDLNGMFLRGWDKKRTGDPDRDDRVLKNGTKSNRVGSKQFSAVGPHKHRIPGEVQFHAMPWQFGGPPPGQDRNNKDPETDMGTPETTRSESRPVNVAVMYCIYAGKKQNLDEKY